MERIKELITILNKANKAYYTDNNEIMSNKEYDQLYDELVALEKTTGIIVSNSPTQAVGYDILKSLNKVTHTTPLLSLDKTKEVDKLESFLGEYEGVLSYKLDGLTVLLTYENGDLLRAVTRGTGTTGEDVTHNARHFTNVPHTIPYKGTLYIRGEAAITYSDFNDINANLGEDEQYKNPRNLCSGTVRQLDSNVLAKRPVGYYAFALMDNSDIDTSRLQKKSDTLEFLQNQGFELAHYQVVTADNVADAVQKFKDNISSSDLPSDGLVLTYDDIAYSQSLGTTSKFPKDSIAFKWEDEVATTTLVAIEWNTSRTGLINPIAIFEPVQLEGTEVKKASLHNLSIVEELALNIGDTITVYKANMIIPQVAENLTKSGAVAPPANCAECGGATTIKDDNAVKTLHCTNPTCSAQQVKALSHYVSRNAMNIEGLSEATLTKFVQQGFVSNFADIYNIANHAEEIKVMEGFGDKSVTKMLASIDKSKSTTLPQFIHALGIFNVGLAGAKLLCHHLDNNIEKIKQATVEELVEIEGFGEIIAQSIVDYFANESNLKLVDKVIPHLTIAQKQETGDTTLQGLTFVITGSVEKFKNRKELQELIESKGGKVTGSVTKNTSYLINNDKESKSAKNAGARKLDIPIINEDELLLDILSKI